MCKWVCILAGRCREPPTKWVDWSIPLLPEGRTGRSPYLSYTCIVSCRRYDSHTLPVGSDVKDWTSRPRRRGRPSRDRWRLRSSGRCRGGFMTSFFATRFDCCFSIEQLDGTKRWHRAVRFDLVHPRNTRQKRRVDNLDISSQVNC